jgi:hypothetical protein
MLKNKKSKAVLLIGGIFALTILLLPPQNKVESASSYFGGRVVSKQECTCSTGYIVSISGPGQATGTYLDTGSEKSYSHNVINPGRNLLGGYTPGGSCMMTGDPCYELKITKGTISFFGASF